MRKVTYEDLEGKTVVMLDKEDAVKVCRLGQGAGCCAFLTCGANGFECEKKTSLGPIIADRLAKGLFVAKGEGGWEGCAWEVDHEGK